MFNAKLFGMVAGAFAMSAAVIGCSGTADDDDATGDDDASGEVTPTPLPPPQLAFTSSDVSVDCTGTNADSTWAFALDVTGWAFDDPAPTVQIFDYSAYATDGDPANAWNEEHTMDLTLKEGDDTTAYYELWDKNDLVKVATFGEQQDSISTIFQCANKAVLTFVFCASDYFYDTAEICVGTGKEVDTYCPECQ